VCDVLAFIKRKVGFATLAVVDDARHVVFEID
jgi:hypothetical protein